MAVTTNVYPAGEYDEVHNIKFVVRHSGTTGPGGVDVLSSGRRKALLTAITSGTITHTGLELVVDC